MHELFNAGTSFGNGEFFKEAPQLHNERHFASCEIFPNDDRGDQGKGYQKVRFDIEFRNDADEGFGDNRHAAEDDGNPGSGEGQRPK